MLRNIKSLLLLLSVLLVCPQAVSKEFYGINDKFGIAVWSVASVCQDTDGFVWASSKGGVMRIAGDELKTYSLPYVAKNIQTVRLSSDNGRLIAFTDNGQLFAYNPVSDCFELIINLLAETGDDYINISCVFAQNDSVLWVSTSDGVYRCALGERPAIILQRNGQSLNWAMSAIAGSRLLVSSAEGLGMIDMASLEYTVLLKADARLDAESVLFIPAGDSLAAGTGTMWIGTRKDGLQHIAIENFRVASAFESVPGFPHQPVYAIDIYDEERIIAGAYGAGLYCVDVDDKTIDFSELNDEDDMTSLPDNGIGGICCTPERVWVATSSSGLCFFNRASSMVKHISHRQTDLNSLASNKVRQTVMDANDLAWVATAAGLDVYNAETRQWRHLLKGKNCTSLAVDCNGRIWAGTFGDGYYVFDANTYKETFHGRDCLFVNAVLASAEGDVWITGVQNVTCIHPDGSSRRYTDMTVNALTELGPDTLALACAHALVLLDKNSGSVKTVADGLMNDVAVSGDTVWAAACGNGVLAYDLKTGEKSYITECDGLASDYTTSLELIGKRLWIGTESGLCRFNLHSKAVTSFQGVPALANIYCNVNASGRIGHQFALGTPDGLYIINPMRHIGPSHDVRIWIDEITLSGKSVYDYPEVQAGRKVSEIDELRLAYNQNDIAISWLPLGTERSVVHMHMALDDEWNDVNGKDITLLNLSTGVHTLDFSLIDNYSGNLLDERHIDICVRPPFWKSWWFRLSITLLLAYLVWVSLGYYTAKIKQRVVPIVSLSRAADTVGQMTAEQVTAVQTASEAEAQKTSEAQTETASGYDNPFVQNAVRVVTENMQNPDFGKDQFASDMNVSRSLLYKKLKALTGQSPTDFIRTMRMGHALRLLQEGRHSVTEISELCGYSSAGYFSTVFKSFYGKSPTEI